ncbi:phosphoribulokinase [Pseudomonas sp. TH31]|nr:phosphoribulokinase [Pseudomonas sp. TH31]
MDDLEPTLTRNGYRMKDLVEQFNAKAHEFKVLFNNTLDPERASELRDKMLAAGIPL